MNRLVKQFEVLVQLRAIIEAGSINRAARILGASQPAMTRSVRRLELLLGVPLLHRTAKGVTATTFTEALLAHVRIADQKLEDALAALDLLKAKHEGRLACGAASVAIEGLIPTAVALLQKRRPHLRLRVVESDPPALLHMLRAGELDLIIVPKIGVLQELNLTVEPLAVEKAVIVVRSNHPLTRRAQHRLADLAQQQQWILPDEGRPLAGLFKEEFDRLGARWPKASIETSSLSMLRHLLLHTNRVAVTLSHRLTADVQQGSVSWLQGDWDFPTTQLVTYRRASSEISPLVRAFVATVKQVLRERA